MSRTRHHGDKAKRRLFGDRWAWWHTTPGWWVRLKMERPQRAAVKAWEHKALRQDIDELDDPPHGRKPHQYYY